MNAVDQGAIGGKLTKMFDGLRWVSRRPTRTDALRRMQSFATQWSSSPSGGKPTASKEVIERTAGGEVAAIVCTAMRRVTRGPLKKDERSRWSIDHYELQRENNAAELAFRGRKRAWKRGWNQAVSRMFRGLRSISLALLVLMLAGCAIAAPSVDEQAVTEYAPVVGLAGSTQDTALPEAGPGSASPDGGHEVGSIPTRVTRDTDAAPRPSEAPDFFAMRDAGACLLPVRYQSGDCACKTGLVCFDRCREMRDGMVELHAFCVDGGL